MHFAPLVPRGMTVTKSTGTHQRSVKSCDPLTATVNFDADLAARRVKSTDHLHEKVRKLAGVLSANAVQLLNTAVISDEFHGGARILSFTRYDVAKALSITEDAAEAARTELIRSGYLVPYDNGSGLSGYRTRL